MEATVHSEAAVVGAREASPEAIRPEVSPVVAPLGVFPVVVPLEVFPVVVLQEVFRAVASQAVAVEVAEAVDQLRRIIEEEDPLILFFLPVVDRDDRGV
jgi:hypothetical protein